jgi:hypothetical protein
LYLFFLHFEFPDPIGDPDPGPDPVGDPDPGPGPELPDPGPDPVGDPDPGPGPELPDPELKFSAKTKLTLTIPVTKRNTIIINAQ